MSFKVNPNKDLDNLKWLSKKLETKLSDGSEFNDVEWIKIVNKEILKAERRLKLKQLDEKA